MVCLRNICINTLHKGDDDDDDDDYYYYYYYDKIMMMIIMMMMMMMMIMIMITIVIRSSCSVYVLDVMVKKFRLGDMTGVNDSGENLVSSTVDYDTV